MRTGTREHYRQERKTRVVQKTKIKKPTRKWENPNRVQNFQVGNDRSRPSEGTVRACAVPSYTRGPDYLSDDWVSDSWISRARIT